MAKKVYIDVIVDDKGTTKKVAVDTQKLGANLEKTSKGAHSADRALKGAAQASSNTTKNFSKMSQGITGGLVPAYATLAANLFAITAAFEFLKKAGNLAALEKAQTQYAYKTGTSMKLLTSRLQEATHQMLAFDDAAQAAAIGTAAGISSDQLERLAKIATNASAALGRDLTDSFNRLTRGAIKAEPELLDELGIIVRLSEAVEEYKRIMNITGRELTTFEKSQAVVNLTIRKGEDAFDDLGKNVNDIAKLGKAVDDLIKALQKGLVPVATFMSNVLTENVLALGAAATAMGTSLIRAIAPAGPAMADLAEQTEIAKRNLIAAGGSGIIGQRIAGGQLGASELGYAERSLKAKGSTVLNFGAIDRKQAKRSIDLIRADQARAVAQMSTGWVKYRAEATAQFKAMQAEHGRVMGAMKAGVGAFARFASKALNAVAILGVITLAISMARELLELLQSDAFRDLEERASGLENKFGPVVEEVSKLRDGLDAASTPLGRFIQQANLLDNIPGLISGKGLGIGSIDIDSLRGLERGTEAYRSAVNELIGPVSLPDINRRLALAMGPMMEAAKLQRDILAQSGLVNASEVRRLDKLIENVEKARNIVKERATTGAAINAIIGLDFDEMENYNNSINNLQLALRELTIASGDLAQRTSNTRGQIIGIAQDQEQFNNILSGFKTPEGDLVRYINLIETLRGKLVGVYEQLPEAQRSLSLEELFPEDQANALARMLNVSTGASLSSLVSEQRDSPIARLGSEMSAMLDRDVNVAKRIETQYNNAAQAFLPFLRENAKFRKQESDILLSIQQIEDDRRKNELGLIELSGQKLSQMTAEEELLRSQLALIRQQHSDMGKLGATLGSSLESGLGKALNDIVVGAANAKEAFANMAKGMIQSLAQVITKLLAVKFIESTLGGTGFGNFLGIGARSGAITEPVPGYAGGGIARGRESGYPAILHGTEAVVPLPNGKEIPVQMRNGGGDNNVVVNVNMDGSSSQESSQGGDQRMKDMGRAISQAVQEELQRQKRPGGILSPYGAA